MPYLSWLLPNSNQFEFLQNISEDPKSLVIGLVRDKVGTEKKVAAELGNRSNVHIVHGDLTSHASLKQAAADTARIVGERGVDYLIANGALTSQFDAYDPISKLQVYLPLAIVRAGLWLTLLLNRCEDPDELDKQAADIFATNATGNIHLFNSFLPLILKGKVKKVIAISSGQADLDLINNLDIEISALYSASKAALNVIVAKFQAQYKKDGVLFLSISPGVVEVGHFDKGMYLRFRG